MVLDQLYWKSLIEIGVGAGANLVNILKHLKDKQVWGIDINPDAIETAKKAIPNAFLKVGRVEDIPMSDDASDVVLTDMTLIYQSPRKIVQALKEIRRIGRNYVVFCEFHHESWWQRFKLRWTKGYYAYDYKKLLTKADFYDIIIQRIPPQGWDGHEPQKTFATIITAKVPKRKF